MSKDTIYREDAIKTLTENVMFEFTEDEEWAITCLQNLPSADRPQGEWLDYEMPLEDGGAMPIQVCNLCKTFYPLAYTGGGHRFCPNCGAEMKGAEEEG